MEPQELPRYQCHKQVGAAQVTGLQFETGTGRITLLTDYGPFNLPTSPGSEYAEGGYVVRYDDGYTSYSPQKAFEDGYTLIEDADAAQGGAEAEPKTEDA